MINEITESSVSEDNVDIRYPVNTIV